MFKHKKLVSIIFVCLFMIYSVLSSLPFQYSVSAVSKKVIKIPKVAAISYDTINYIGIPLSCKINSSNYSGNVQYKAYITNTDTGKVQDITNGYSKAFKASTIVTVKYPSLTAGNYKITIYVKRSGNQVKYDNYLIKSFVVRSGIIINKSNTTYESSNLNNNLIINGNNVTVKNSKISGTIIINPGINGTAILDDVTASNIEVKSGKTNNGLTLNNIKVLKTFSVNTDNKNVIGIKTSGETNITSTLVASNAMLQADSDNFGIINVNNIYNQQINLEIRGDIDKCIVVKTNSNVKVGKGFTASKMQLASTNTANKITLTGNVRNIEVAKPCQLFIKSNSQVNQINILNNAAINIEKNAIVDEIINKNSKVIKLVGEGSKNVHVLKNLTLLKDISSIKIGIGEIKDITIDSTPADAAITAISNKPSNLNVSPLNGKTIRIIGLHKGKVIVTVFAKKFGLGSGIKTFVVDVSGIKTVQGNLNISPVNASFGSKQIIVLNYNLGEDYVNGKLVFKLPSDFAATSEDTITIGNAASTKLNQAFISGNNVIIDNINAKANQTITLTLNNRTLSKPQVYNFSVNGDADGAGDEKTATDGSGSEMKNFEVINKLPTTQGTLVVTPENVSQGSTNQTITLMYILGENFNNGSITFTLPNGFIPSAADTISIAGGKYVPVGANAITANSYIINNITANTGSVLTINLINRTIPYYATKCTFSASSDADGSGTIKLPTEGTGNERKDLNVNSVSATISGVLTIKSPFIITNTAQPIILSYTLGENYIGGKVQFNLPNQITPQSTDTICIGNGIPQVIGIQSISGQTVTVNNINAAAGDVVTLTLFNKTIKDAGKYPISVIGDADGYPIAKSPTSGTSSESAVLTVNASPTNSGILYLTPNSATAYATNVNIMLIYTLGENYTNGVVQFMIPTGIAAYASDKVSIKGGTPVNLGSYTISGQMVIINNVTANTGDSVILTLSNKTISSANNLTFSAVGDADGYAGSSKIFSIKNSNEEKVLVVNGVPTIPGELTLSPLSVSIGVPNTITLTYTLGEAYKAGKVEFTLPPIIKAAYDDIVKINNTTSNLLGTATILNNKVTVNNITAASGTQVKLILLDKTISTQSSYLFSAVGDADGISNAKTDSPGTGKEVKILVAGTAVAPTITSIIKNPINLHQGYSNIPSLTINGTNLSYITSLIIAGDNRLPTLNVISANQVTGTLALGKLAGDYNVIIGTSGGTTQAAITILPAPAVTDKEVYIINSNNETLTLTGASSFDNTPIISTKGYNASFASYDAATNIITFIPSATAVSTGQGNIVVTNADGTFVTKQNAFIVLPGTKSGALTDSTGLGTLSCITALADESLNGNVYLVKASTADEAVNNAKEYSSDNDFVWKATGATSSDSPGTSLITSLRGSGGNVYAVWISSDGSVDDAKKLFKVTDLSDNN